MPLSVTCQCGAQLEIDDKFLGKEIPCPDCQRLLPTNVPAKPPPPLELPDNRRTSGLAALSLALALAGAFTVVGTLAAIAVGVLAIRQIAKHPMKLEGLNLARAGIALGGAFTFITLAALISPTVFGLDVFLRELAMVNRVEYQPKNIVESVSGDIQIDKQDLPGLWGKYNQTQNKRTQAPSDPLILVNVSDDAFLACQSAVIEGGEKIEEIEKKVLEHFYKSELVGLLGRLQGQPLGREGTVSERKPVPNKNNWHEITVDLRLGGVERRFLIRYESNPNQVNLRSDMLIGCARRNRFERWQDDFRKAFDKYQRKL